LHPNDFASRQPEFIAQHSVLAFLGKKICHFIHDFHPDWIARLCLPPANGEHNQLIPLIQMRILRRIQPLQSMSKKGAITSERQALLIIHYFHPAVSLSRKEKILIGGPSGCLDGQQWWADGAVC
jgi:hypothetical protein